MTIDNFKKELKDLLNKYNTTIETVFDDCDDGGGFVGLEVWLRDEKGHFYRSDLTDEDLIPDKKKD